MIADHVNDYKKIKEIGKLKEIRLMTKKIDIKEVILICDDNFQAEFFDAKYSNSDYKFSVSSRSLKYQNYIELFKDVFYLSLLEVNKCGHI